MHSTRQSAPKDRARPRGARLVLAITTRPRRALILFALAVVLIIFVGHAGARAFAGAKVPRGTRVLGIEISGLKESAAIERLNARIGARARQPLVISAKGRRVTLQPAEAGLSLDARATVESAIRGRFGLTSVFGTLYGGRDIAPRIRLDGPRLAAAIERANTQIGTPAREGKVRFHGTTPEVVLPRPGEGLDARQAAAPVRSAYLKALQGKSAPLDLPTGRLRPTTNEEAVRQAAAGSARIAVSGPVTLQTGGEKLTVEPKAFAPYLTFESDGGGSMRPQVDASKLARALDSRLTKVEQRARDATFKIKKGEPQLVPAATGREVAPQALGDAVVAAALRTAGREANVPLITAEPRVTTEEARRLGVREKISGFTTRHACCAPRVTNIHTVADILDGYIVRPGETFSLNGIVGERDEARGFVPAPMILEGRYADDVGGGISQFATTMFNAVFFGGLQDVQHTPHSFYISRYPAGRESTVSFPQPDFRWRNDSPYGVMVDTSYTGTSLTVNFWSTKRYEIESKSSERYAARGFETKTDSGKKCIPMPGAEGFQIDVWRIFKQDGKVVRRQKFHTTYLPEPRVTCE
ncbi:VanW family protein [Spirillospora sp. CA-142024]|uniref:VanW family protein n=1 Tax=Spirillospora sp. CA-142024 TaxID=3240036 RepID=UPI003D8C3301